MRRRRAGRPVAGRALGLAFALTTIAAAAVAAPLEVWIERPRSAEFVFGRIDFVARVVGEEPIARVELLVDGRSVATLVRPPYRVEVDLGNDNVEHQFEVVAHTTRGRTAAARVVTPKLQVDDVVEVELQQLYVTATAFGRRVLDLRREDFRIHDRGKRQKIVTFERGDVPLTAVVLLDCSLSMRGERLAAARRGARVFLKGMRELDEAEVVLFSDRMLRSTAFSGDAAALKAALDGVTASGGTAINDHLFLALQRLDTRQGRRVVVLFSDGSDVHSVLEMEQVADKAKGSQALIYWIHLMEEGESAEELPSYRSSWRGVADNQRELRQLREAVGESGGRIQFLTSIDQLEDAFAEILAELREQYVLGYYPTDDRGDGSWHKVRVQVSRPEVELRTRGGYYDF